MNVAWASDPLNLPKIAMLEQLAKANLPCGVNWFSTAAFKEPDGLSRKAALQTMRNLFPVASMQDYADAFTSSRLVKKSFVEHVPTDSAGRPGWMERCLRELRECSVLFFDPDTGIGERVHPQYTTPAEVTAAARQAHVVVYQHMTREGPEKRHRRITAALDSTGTTAEHHVRFLRFREERRVEFVVVECSDPRTPPLPTEFGSAFTVSSSSSA